MNAPEANSGSRPVWKRVFFIAILGIVFPLAALVTLEGLLRLAGFGYPTGLFLEAEDRAGVLHANPDYTAPWFGRAGARKLFPLSISGRPAAGACRIIILGASAALGDPAPSYSPARLLQCALESAYPEREFECINLAMTAIDSGVVRDVAREAVRLQPEIAIIYLGNNEVIGPFGPASGPAAWRAFAGGPRLATALRRTRVSQAVAALLDEPGNERQWAGMARFLEHRFAADAPELEPVYQRFEDNLRAIVQRLAQAGIQPVLSTVAVNLLDQPPFLGKDALDTHLEGVRLAATGQTAEALELLRLARDRDELRFRADSRINALVRKVSREWEVPLIEAAEAFNNPARLAGPELFLEHVHFTFQGNIILTEQFFKTVSTQLLRTGRIGRIAGYPSAAYLQSRLAYTPFDEYLIASEMVDRLGKAPFTAVHDNPVRLERFTTARDGIRTSLSQTATRDRILDTYQRARDANPDDWVLQRNMADALRLYGRFGEAARLYAAVLQHFPGLEDARANYAVCLAAIDRASD